MDVAQTNGAAGIPTQVVSEYVSTALADDYDNVIQTTMEWVTVH